VKGFGFALFILCYQSLMAEAPPGADSEAGRALNILKQLITTQNFKDYGLTTYEQVSQLKLIGGVDVFYVFNDDLKNFTPDKIPGSVVTPSQTRIYPVTNDGHGCVLITVRYREGRWRTAGFGQISQAYNLARMINSGASHLYVIELPSLNLAYASPTLPRHDSDMELFALSPESFRAANPGITPDRNFGLSVVMAGMPGRNVFKALAPVARKLREGPPAR
jgi:hypothetical protein